MSNKSGFTIVELLVVIVVIGILAAVTIVSYSGISQKAIVSSIQADLVGASKQVKLFEVTNGNYPTTSNCGQADSATNKCLKASGSNTIGYVQANTSTNKGFLVVITNGNNCYSITRDTSPSSGCITIGGQLWLKDNLNVGTMKTPPTAQSNDGSVEKYCYSDIESNCDLYGGLYQWDEAMNYVATEGAQGICPAGFHIPSDTEWKTTEMTLGMSQAQADATGGRGTDQGVQLRLGGSSGFNAPYGGYWDNSTGYQRGTQRAEYWTSTSIGGAGTLISIREIMSAFNQSYRYTNYPKAWALSVRCVKN